MTGMNWPLPSGWKWVALRDVAFINPKGFAHPPKDDELLSFVPMAAVEEETGHIDASIARPWAEIKKGYTAFEEGDILFTKVTPCMENGKCALASSLVGGRGAGSTELFVVRPHSISTRYLLHFLLWDAFRREAAGAMQGVAGLLRVRREFMEGAMVPLPPEGEQARIVGEVDRHFSRLQAAEGSLARAGSMLQRFRSAVLAQTFPSGPTDGWTPTPIEELVTVIDYRGRTPPYVAEGIPHLRSSNIKRGTILWEDLRFVTEETYQKYMTRGIPVVGDVLLTTEAPLGEVALVPAMRFSLAQRMMVLRPNPSLISTAFLKCQLMSSHFQSLLSRSGTGSTVTGISSRNFRALTIPVPPLADQERIASQVDAALTQIEEVASGVRAAARRAARLRSAILRSAFGGRLLQ